MFLLDDDRFPDRSSTPAEGGHDRPRHPEERTPRGAGTKNSTQKSGTADLRPATKPTLGYPSRTVEQLKRFILCTKTMSQTGDVPPILMPKTSRFRVPLRRCTKSLIMMNGDERANLNGPSMQCSASRYWTYLFARRRGDSLGLSPQSRSDRANSGFELTWAAACLLRGERCCFCFSGPIPNSLVCSRGYRSL
jgi:hypothetical protein